MMASVHVQVKFGEWRHVPPFSMPLTAASLTVLLAASAASFAESIADFWVRTEVLKRRAFRAMAARNMVAVMLLVLDW